MSLTALHIDASARKADSITRKYTQKVLDRFEPERVLTRDLNAPLPFLDEEWVNANFTPIDQRSDAQKNKLAVSDELICVPCPVVPVLRPCVPRCCALPRRWFHFRRIWHAASCSVC